MAEIKVGDTVTLKTKSPHMTVTHVDTTTKGALYVNTTWFAGSKMSTGRFPVDALVIVPPDEPKAQK